MAHESFAKMRQGNDASSKVGRALYVNQSANAGRSSTRTPSAADCLRAPFFVVRLRAIATRRKAPAFPKDRHSPGVAVSLGASPGSRSQVVLRKVSSSPRRRRPELVERHDTFNAAHGWLVLPQGFPVFFSASEPDGTLLKAHLTRSVNNDGRCHYFRYQLEATLTP